MKIRSLSVIVCLLVMILLLQSRLEGQEEKVEQPLASEATQEHVMEVFNDNARTLEKDNPDVLGVVPDPGNGTIWIITDRPDAVPKQIGDVPVTIKPAPPHLPPPPGVILLKPDGVQEPHTEMEECPPDYAREMRRYRWRFCQSTTGLTETIPALMAPPIAGIPFSEVKAIVERNREKLLALPGVTSVGISAEGIHIETDQPEVVPTTVEGLPTKPVSIKGGRWQSTNHTTSSVTDPFHGGVAGKVHTQTTSDTPFTLGGVVLSDGKPWLITAGHAITANIFPTTNTVCPAASCVANPLNACPHYSNSPLALMQQSPTSNPQTVAYMAKWPFAAPSSTPNIPGTLYDVADVAAGFLDNDVIEGNASLSADRRLTGLPTATGLPGGGVQKFSGTITDPMVQDYIYIVSARSAQSYPGCGTVTAAHVNPGQVSRVDITQVSGLHCSTQVNDFNVRRIRQVEYTTTFAVLNGISGAVVLNPNGLVVAIQNLGFQACSNASCSGTICPLNVGQGVLASYTKSLLGFDAWYGEDTIKDNSIGLFRPSNALWSRDNGNGKFDGCGAEINEANATTKDYCYGVFGAPGKNDIAVTGDWNGDGSITPGVYHTDPTACPNPASQCFQLTNFFPAVNVTLHTAGPEVGYKPVVGKWTGPNFGRTKMGVFSAQSGVWYLENGDGVVNGCTVDYCFNTASWTQVGDLPIAGDWDSNGTVTIGVFRPGNGNFYLSNTALGVGAQPQLNWAFPAAAPNSGYVPVVGNWTGTPGDKLGLFNSSISRWYLDNGNRIWPSCAQDQCSTLYIGAPGDNPAVFGTTTVRAN